MAMRLHNDSYQRALVCASCEMELAGTGVVVAGRSYCCKGCAEGGPCVCTYGGSLSRPSAEDDVGTLGNGFLFDSPRPLS